NANDTDPVPLETLTIDLAAPAQPGDTRITLDAASAARVVPRYTGLDGLSKSGAKASVIITAVDASTGRASLSRPLPRALPAGPARASTLLYEPFARPSTAGGAPNPAFEETMRGWLAYVGVVTRTVKRILGGDQFDLEVWNELSFGSGFLSIQRYYEPE